jgi:hypothetical protein
MRFSIVCDDNGTILAASQGEDEAETPVGHPGENTADFGVPDHLAEDELHEAVERLFLDLDAKRLALQTLNGEKKCQNE